MLVIFFFFFGFNFNWSTFFPSQVFLGSFFLPGGTKFPWGHQSLIIDKKPNWLQDTKEVLVWMATSFWGDGKFFKTVFIWFPLGLFIKPSAEWWSASEGA